MLDKLENLIKAFGTVCIALLFMLTSIQVILRYGFDHTYFFTEELGRYLLVWSTLAGTVIETRRSGHIRVGFLVDRLPAQLRRTWQVLVDIIILVLFMLLVYTGIDSTIFNHGQESAGLQIPLSIPFAAIPLFFFLAAVFMLERLWRASSRRK